MPVFKGHLRNFLSCVTLSRLQSLLWPQFFLLPRGALGWLLSAHAPGAEEVVSRCQSVHPFAPCIPISQARGSGGLCVCLNCLRFQANCSLCHEGFPFHRALEPPHLFSRLCFPVWVPSSFLRPLISFG